MKRISFFLGALVLLATALPVSAQIGGAAVVFLMIEPDSRAAGMGNAGVALADNANATFWNPAGLGFQEGASVGITHSNWLPEFNANLYYEYAVAKYNLPGVGTFGAHLTFFNLGKHDCVDDLNQPCGQFRSYDMAAGLSYGKKITDHLSLGTGVRFIYSNLATGVEVAGGGEAKAGVSAGVDVGLLYRTSPIDLGGTKTTLSAGFNLANMGPTIKYIEKRDPIPTSMRFGWASTFEFDEYNSLTLVNDFTKALYRVRRDSVDGELVRTVDPFYKAIFSAWRPITVDLTPGVDDDPKKLSVLDQLVIGLGAEYWYNKLFALRSGYFYENPYNGNRKFVTLGAGIRYNIVGVDFSYIYALEEGNPLANTLRFSLLIDL